MNKKRSVIFFALLLSCLFSAIYVIGFMMITPQSTITRLSMNQIGIYQNQDNADKVMESLTAMNLKPYSYQQDSLTIVVCSLSEDGVKTKADQTILAGAGYAYIYKEIESKDSAFKEAVKNQDFEKVMELMQNQGKGN
ncbi:hypothetical protein [Dielma fastidiosa]|uniref:Uncharacterized protein n=1 Tax=Dielma fastidiosa TaxID=1034346 RepID=A0AB35UTX5_9FIRM|nr:hypothetical protein [Dielma fastidiosa]MDY5168550.1 hypothetical protein [Dielma fastidiosa]